MLLVTSSPDELLDTVRSRCQRVDLQPLSEATIRDVLAAGGADAEAAALAARLAGGRLDRGRAMLSTLGVVRRAFVRSATTVDGSGASAMRAADDVGAALQVAVTELEAEQAVETGALEAELERAGYPDRSRTALLKRLAERHKRHHRRARRELIVEGLAALESVYRDALAGDDALRLNTDQPVLRVDPEAAAAAIDACGEARAAFEFNPHEGLLLERLMLHLPAAR
jgi:DNA polymerase-3 subunit delta'